MKNVISFNINGEDIQVLAEPNRTLLDLLRDDLGLTGTKKGCEAGECGACTVMLDGRPVNSCITLAAEVEGCKVITVEGVAQDGQLSPLQRQFIDKWAFQCGYCTAGMILSAKALLERNPHPTEQEIREAIEGNLCRCTGYVKIIEAIQAVVAEMDAMGWEVKA